METFSVLHLFAGIGGGSLGFQAARASWKGLDGRFRTMGAVDVDPLTCAGYETLTGEPATRWDLFSREDYEAFHGHAPPDGWHEVTAQDFRDRFGDAPPDVVFQSSPCKGFSGLLPHDKAQSEKYQALNRLALRGVWLTLEAWPDPAPRIILFENVPRIRQRGKVLLHQLEQLFRRYGFAWRAYDHDAGEIGGLAQRRVRFLGIARNTKRVRPFVYQPPVKPLKSVGSVLERLPMPDDPAAGSMHRLPRLQLLTWIRLALIPAGKDWRALQDVERVEFYQHAAPGWSGQPLRANGMRIVPWNGQCHTVAGHLGGSPMSGTPIVADPRSAGIWYENSIYRVCEYDQPIGTVTTGSSPSAGAPVVADPRLPDAEGRHTAKYRTSDWSGQVGTITGQADIQTGAPIIADPRLEHGPRRGVYRVERWDSTCGAVTGAEGVGRSNTPTAVSDPRLGCAPRAGSYGVLDWENPAPTVAASADVHAGAAAVADPRWVLNDRPEPPPVIVALDGTWHRPLTTLELAALQGLPVRRPDGNWLELPGSDAKRREMIGNVVPPPTAQAIADEILMTLLMEVSGSTFRLSMQAPWVRRDDEARQ